MIPRSIGRLLASLAVTMLMLTSAVPLTAFGEEPPLPESNLETVAPPVETSPESSSTPPVGNLPLGLSDLEIGNLPLGFCSAGAGNMLAVDLFDHCNISADVSFDAANPANGDLIVTLKLEKLNAGNKVTGVWYQTLRYTDGTRSRNFQFLDLRSGRYRLTQLPVMRYSRQKLTNKSVSGNVVTLGSYSVTYDLNINASSGYAAFHNKRTTDKWFTHTDMVVNRIYLPARGGNDVLDS